MDELDKLKENIIGRYNMALALNGDEICKEIDSILPDDLDLMRMKAHCYCLFYLRADVSKNQTLAGNSQKIDFAHTFKFDTLSC